MIYEKRIKNIYDFNTGRLVHEFHFTGLSSEHTETYPNSVNGVPISEGSTYTETDTDNYYRWTGNRWHLSGSGPVPPEQYVNIKFQGIHVAINGSEEAIIKLPLNEPTTIPFEITDYKFNYPFTQDDIGKRIIIMEPDIIDFKLDVEKSTMTITPLLQKDQEIVLIGCDGVILKHVGYDKIPCDYLFNNNMDTFKNDENETYFAMSHTDNPKHLQLVMHDGEPDVSNWNVPKQFQNVKIEGNTIEFDCNEPCFFETFSVDYPSEMTSVILNPYWGTMNKDVATKQTVQFPAQERCFIPCEPRGKMTAGFLWGLPGDKDITVDEFKKKFVVLNGGDKLPDEEWDVALPETDNPGIYINTSKYKDLEVQYYGCDTFIMQLNNELSMPENITCSSNIESGSTVSENPIAWRFHIKHNDTEVKDIVFSNIKLYNFKASSAITDIKEGIEGDNTHISFNVSGNNPTSYMTADTVKEQVLITTEAYSSSIDGRSSHYSTVEKPRKNRPFH